MDDKAANIIRNTAHEIIIRLYDAQRVEALELLRQHCDRALEEIAKIKERI